MSNELASVVCQFTPAVQTELSNAVAAAHLLEEIVDVPTYDAARLLDVRLNKAVKAVGEERLSHTRKIDALKKRATDYEKQVCASATEIQAALTAALNDYDTKIREEKMRREAHAKAVEEVLNTGESEYETPALVAVVPVLEAPVAPTRKVARLVITDRELVPTQFWVIDEAALATFLKAGNTTPGAEIVYDEIRVRR